MFWQGCIQSLRRGVRRAAAGELQGRREHKLADAAGADDHGGPAAVRLQHRNVCRVPACMQHEAHVEVRPAEQDDASTGCIAGANPENTINCRTKDISGIHL